MGNTINWLLGVEPAENQVEEPARRVGEDYVRRDHNLEKYVWHSSGTFNEKVLNFHDKLARQPSGTGLSQAKEKLEQLKQLIKIQVEEQGIFKFSEFLFKGSSYEGVKVKRSSDNEDLEFDLDFVIKGGEHLRAVHIDSNENSEDEHGLTGWYELRLNERKIHNLVILEKATENGKISGKRVMELFYGNLIKCKFVNDCNITIRYHGPAVQLDVPKNRSSQIWFSVDLAPAFYLEGNITWMRYSECYVIKPNDSWNDLWYRSYSLEEKQKLDNAGGCRKVVLRTLKAMRLFSPQFLGLQSYHMKMALFQVMDKKTYEHEWTRDKTGERLIDVLLYLHHCLDAGVMSHYFNKTVNILKLNYRARMNLRDNIYNLTRNEKRMTDFIDRALSENYRIM